MNPLMALLRSENNFTIKRLKQVYRALCKKTHPDLTKGAGADFIRLRKDYEEAHQILSARKPGQNTAARDRKPAAGRDDPRRTVMEKLYLFTLKIFSRDGDRLLSELIETAGSYNTGVRDMLQSYNEAFYSSYHQWKSDGSVFYTHNLFISAVKQLFYYYAHPITLHKNLFLFYLDDLKSRIKSLDEEKRQSLLKLSAWLKDELTGRKIIP